MIFIDEQGHLATDGNLEELHALAQRIGLLREWYQDKGKAARHPHYDVMGKRLRQEAINAGAVPVGSKELYTRCFCKRGEGSFVKLKLIYTWQDKSGCYMLVHIHQDRPRQSDAQVGLNRPWFLGWERHGGDENPYWIPFEGRDYTECPICHEKCPTEEELEAEFQRLDVSPHAYDFWGL